MKTKGITCKKDGWTFDRFPATNKIVCASKTVRWYNEEAFKVISKMMKKHQCKTFWNSSEDVKLQRRRLGSTVEIYKIFNTDDYKTCIQEFLEILKDFPSDLKELNLNQL